MVVMKSTSFLPHKKKQTRESYCMRNMHQIMDTQMYSLSLKTQMSLCYVCHLRRTSPVVCTRSEAPKPERSSWILKNLRDSLGTDISDALIGLHAFTGCDTVSAFVGRGKTAPLDRLRSSREFQETFASLGATWDVSDELFAVLQHFTCLLYAPSSNTRHVNELRYEMFLAKRGEVESSLLPPCEDSLLKHARRANYQVGVWRRSLERNPDIPDAAGHGWTKGDDGFLNIDWMKGMPAPDGVTEMIACQCRRECRPESCICIRHVLRCTPLCKLQNCGNQNPDDSEHEDSVDINSDSGDDCCCFRRNYRQDLLFN